MKFGSLFAGVGGFDLGLEAAGWQCAWQVEWDTPKRVNRLWKIRGKQDQPTTENQASENQALIKELIPSTSKDLQSELETQPKLCGYCTGAGWLAQGFMGQPMLCPDCKGDGVAR